METILLKKTVDIIPSSNSLLNTSSDSIFSDKSLLRGPLLFRL